MELRRIFKLFAVGALLAPTAIVQPALADVDKVKVSTPGDARFAQIMTEMKSAFEETHEGVVLEHSGVGDNWGPLLQTTLRQALVEDLPDASHQALNYTRLLVERGIAQPLDQFIEAEGGWEKMGFPSAMKEAVTYNGEIYALPFATTIPVLYYNMDLLKKAGYTKDTPPETWDEIFEVAGKVDALGDGVMGAYLEYHSTSAWMFQTFLMGLDGRMMDAGQKQITFDSEKGLRALEMIAAFGKVSGPDVSKSQARQSFNAGKLGMLVRSASGIPGVAKAADGNFALYVDQLPTLSDKGVLPGAGNGLVMFATDTKQQAAAWEYMKLASSPVGQTILATNTGYMPINSHAVDDPKYLAGYFEAHPFQRATLAQLPKVSDWFAFPGENSTRIFDMMIEQQRQLVIGKTTPEKAMKVMVSETKQLLP